MKRKIRLTDKTTGKIIEGETEIRNTLHFEVQKATRANIFKPKKGKGSYVRHKKVEDVE